MFTTDCRGGTPWPHILCKLPLNLDLILLQRMRWPRSATPTMILSLPKLRFTILAFRSAYWSTWLSMQTTPMKTIPLILSMLVLTCTGVVAQKQTAPLKKRRPILFDFRVQRPVDPPKIPTATETHVLSKVFRKYLTDESKCEGDFYSGSVADPLKAARDAGQIVPSIIDVASGSFTAPGRTETAYVISVSECNASHADNFGTDRVAIFAGQQLIVDLDVDFKSSIVRKTDLDGDGIEELLMASSDMHQGQLTEMAALLSFQRGRVRVIEDLGMVTNDSCASELPGSSARASVVSLSDAVPGQTPKMRIENYQASCRNSKRWRLISTGKMQE